MNTFGSRRLPAGRLAGLIVISGVFGCLNLFSILQWVVSGGEFGTDALLDLNNAFWILTPLMYALIIVLGSLGFRLFASLALIPIILTDVLYVVWSFAAGYSAVDTLPIVSIFAGWEPEYLASGVIVAFEPLAVVALGLLLLLPTTAPRQIVSNPSSRVFDPTQTTHGPSMFCPICGHEAGAGGFCTKCGSKLGAADSRVATGLQGFPQTSGLAIAAFVVSLFFSLIGLILGYVAQSQIDNSGGRLAGRGFATAAIVIGWVGMAFGVIGLILLGVAASSFQN